MKKAGKLISYLLVLTLITGLFSGLGIANSSAIEAKADETYYVLEIVPDKSMATFFYLVDMTKHTNTIDPKIGGKKIASNVVENSSKPGKFLKGLYGQMDGNTYKSTDYFYEKILKPAGKQNVNIKVVTVTPSDFTEKTIDSYLEVADLIVINETVPEALQVSGVEMTTFRQNNFTNGEVLKIFKKIAGVNGNPVPYLIDYKLYDCDDLFDVRDVNESKTTGTNDDGTPKRYGKRYGYVAADNVHELREGDTGNDEQTLESKRDQIPNLGSDTPSFKLYKLLSCIDPSTLYGLYFTETDGSYGVDEDLNLIYMKPAGSNNVPISYNLNGKGSGWTDDYFRPNYMSKLQNQISNVKTHDITKDMGWFEVDNVFSTNRTNDDVSAFSKVIGAGNGHGIVYYSARGIFGVFKNPNGGNEPEYSVINAEAYLGSNGSYNSGTYENVQIKINNKSGSNKQNWRFSFSLKGIKSIKYNNSTISADSDGYVALTNPNWLNQGNGNDLNVYIVTDGTVSIDQIKNAVKKGTVEVAGVSGSNSKNPTATFDEIKSCLTHSLTTDYHTYRFLVITENKTDSSMNRNLVSKMVKEANTKGIGLTGGVIIECMGKLQFENLCVDLNQTYDAICVKNCTLTDVGKAKLDSYSDKKLTGGDCTDTNLINHFKDIVGRRFGIDYMTLPAKYYVDFEANYDYMNGHSGYSINGDSLKVPGNVNYINDDDNSGKKSLDFKFRISGTSTYSIDLYVDVSNDGIYDDSDNSKEKKRLADSFQGGLNNNFTKNVELTDFLPATFVGGFAWKIVVTDNTSGKAVSRIGYSAIRNESITGQKIRILQIYPTDYYKKYGSDDGSKWISNPMLLIPTKEEVAAAALPYNASTNPNGKGRGSILGYTWAGTNDLRKYFDDVLKVDIVKSNASVIAQYDKFDTIFDTNDDNSTVATNVTLDYDNLGDSATKRKDLMHNTSVFYQFLALLNNYDIDATKYSVYGFSQAYGSEVVYDKNTGKFAPMTGPIVKNLDGSDRYGYTPYQLGLDTNESSSNYWAKKKRNWSEGEVSRYITNEAGTLIYGERNESDGSITYYESKRNGKDGKAIRGPVTDPKDQFDMIMIGFGSTMDFMAPKAVDAIRTYLANGGPAFVGNGAVTVDSNNNLGDAIKDIIGMSGRKLATNNWTQKNSDYNPFGSEHHTMMVTNDTLFSHYPYVVNHYLNTSEGSIQPYALNFTGEDDPIVSYARYGSNQDGSASNTYTKWGNAEEAYYLYRYKNITFCGFGNTFRSGQADSKISSVMSVAETLMIVNALITAASGGQNSTKTDPYITCIDADGSYISEGMLEGDMAHSFKDSVYTNFDSKAIAEFKNDNSKTQFNTPVYGTMTVSEFSKEYSGDEGDKLKHLGFVDENTKTRWIPYKAVLATKNGGYLDFWDADSKVALNLSVYKFEYNETTDKYSYKLQNKDGNGLIKIDENAVYYIGVPIEAKTNIKGFMINKSDASKNVDQYAVRFRLYADGERTSIVEEHIIMMIRRVIYMNK